MSDIFGDYKVEGNVQQVFEQAEESVDAPRGPLPVGRYLAVVLGVEPYPNEEKGSFGHMWHVAILTDTHTEGWFNEVSSVPQWSYTGNIAIRKTYGWVGGIKTDGERKSVVIGQKKDGGIMKGTPSGLQYIANVGGTLNDDLSKLRGRVFMANVTHREGMDGSDRVYDDVDIRALPGEARGRTVPDVTKLPDADMTYTPPKAMRDIAF